RPRALVDEPQTTNRAHPRRRPVTPKRTDRCQERTLAMLRPPICRATAVTDHHRRMTGVLALLFAAVAASACGGAPQTTSSTPSALAVAPSTRTADPTASPRTRASPTL